MNTSPTSPARPTAKQPGRWLLEIVRGRDVGRTFALDPGETVVGNALNGQRGLDLLDQEGNSPRRMAARHAALACSGQDLSIRDLESPGGTFVNQQRLLSGQPRKLSPGDVIQLGGVQLKVKQEARGGVRAAAPQPVPQARLPVAAVRAGARTAGNPARSPPQPAAPNASCCPTTGPAAPTPSRRSTAGAPAPVTAPRRGGRLPTAFHDGRRRPVPDLGRLPRSLGPELEPGSRRADLGPARRVSAADSAAGSDSARRRRSLAR